MHFKFSGEETCNRRKKCTQQDADHKGKDYPGANGQAGKIKNMPKDRARVNSLVHNNGSCGHSHTHHTANGKVRTGKKD